MAARDPPTAAHSCTPLATKLWYKAGTRAFVVGAPLHYPDLLANALPAGVVFHDTPVPNLDLIHLFSDQRAVVERDVPPLVEQLGKAGMLRYAR